MLGEGKQDKAEAMDRIVEIKSSESIGGALMLFTQTSRLVSKYIDAYFYHKNGLSFIKFLVLKTLASRNGVMTPSQIAEWTQTELHNITALVGRLKKEGSVVTKRSDIDRRSINIFLTDKGRMVIDQSMPVAEEIIAQLMSSVTEADAIKLSRVLKVLRDNAYDGLEKMSSDFRK